jgi:hypothetical protein
MRDLAPPRRWEDARTDLLALAAADLDAAATPAPTLLAFGGDDALAVVSLRPFERDELVQALLEVLALLLPIGADRVAVSLPGRAWRLDEPVAPVAPDLDLRRPVVVVTTADASQGPCTTTTTVHPVHVDDDGWRWLGGFDAGADDDDGAPAVAAMRLLLDARGELSSGVAPDPRLAAQLGRVLLLGHVLALSPTAATALEQHTVA